LKELRLRNWARFPIEPRKIEAVILTHAHLDHTGYLPLLVKQGFTEPVLCSEATADFCAILLPDAGHLQEQDAEFANRHGFSKHKPADAKNTILFAGFQAAGTRGAAMVAGAESVKIHGEQIPIRAEVHNLDMLSAHADADEILRWLRGFAKPPRMTFVVHGEPSASDALRHRIEAELGWRCLVPDHGQQVELA
jgi:Cft2 family RNA processing exonuclease